MAAQNRLSRSADDASGLRVYLLGPIRLECANRAVDIPSKRARALVAFLASRVGMDVPRSVVTALLWGDRAEAQARASLRQALSELRATFSALGFAPIESTKEAVKWVTGSAWVDAVELTSRAHDDAIDESMDAASLATGEFMEGSR